MQHPQRTPHRTRNMQLALDSANTAASQRMLKHQAGVDISSELVCFQQKFSLASKSRSTLLAKFKRCSVSELSLADFYHKILPYFMVETAQRFARMQ
jgi:hypothetical protein